MSTTAGNHASIRSGEQLAQYLQQHPEASMRPPEELAGQFGLAPDFVAEVLKGVRTPRKRSEVPSDYKQFGFIFTFLHWCRVWFRVLTNKPIVFIFVTLVVAIAVSTYLLRVEADPSSTLAFGRPVLLQAYAMIAVGILHLACYYRHAMVRYALYGGLVCWLTLAPLNMVVTWVEIQNRPPEFITGTLLIVAIQTLMLSAQYTLMAAGAAVLGGLVWIKRREREIRNLTRQQLLARLFEVRERLQGAGGPIEDPESAWRTKWTTAFRQKWPVWSALAGLLFSTVYMGMLNTLGWPAPPDPISTSMLSVGMAVFVLIELVILSGIGFLSGGVWLALAGAWTYQIASFLPMMMPLRGFGFEWVVGQYGQPRTILLLATYTSVIAIISGLGARVDERRIGERKLRSNDPAALLAEMVRIQWLIAPNPKEVTILVVDAVRSSEMKASADPLEVEYSFREYQAMIKRIVEAQGGTVHSTAGDGAVVAFSEAGCAFEAARRVRTEIDLFNRETNRLPTPFRLRIGLHSGPVAGDLEQVQFSEVIDIAAHVQGAAPVGGITMTESVAERLGSARVAPMQDPVDGHKILLALDPTVDL
jgi:class 3 adenylate cyclase